MNTKDGEHVGSAPPRVPTARGTDASLPCALHLNVFECDSPTTLSLHQSRVPLKGMHGSSTFSGGGAWCSLTESRVEQHAALQISVNKVILFGHAPLCSHSRACVSWSMPDVHPYASPLRRERWESTRRQRPLPHGCRLQSNQHAVWHMQPLVSATDAQSPVPGVSFCKSLALEHQCATIEPVGLPVEA